VKSKKAKLFNHELYYDYFYATAWIIVAGYKNVTSLSLFVMGFVILKYYSLLSEYDKLYPSKNIPYRSHH